jgi:hypothetical protein
MRAPMQPVRVLPVRLSQGFRRRGFNLEVEQLGPCVGALHQLQWGHNTSWSRERRHARLGGTHPDVPGPRMLPAWLVAVAVVQELTGRRTSTPRKLQPPRRAPAALASRATADEPLGSSATRVAGSSPDAFTKACETVLCVAAAASPSACAVLLRAAMSACAPASMQRPEPQPTSTTSGRLGSSKRDALSHVHAP